MADVSGHAKGAHNDGREDELSHTERLSIALADRYRITRHLGTGGMASVYLAQDLKHERQVAIKVLKPELAAVLGAERFVVEIKTTAALQHPHILPLFDSGTADGFLFYVMPYIEGETLRDRLNRDTQLGVDEAVRLTRELADALDYAHRHGIIHRDVKPENILLHDGRAMVMDFGIALAVSAAAGGRMTETGLSLGTPHYMSPEQATAEKEITARSDVYSLASVLYEMLAGQPPHIGTTAQQIIMKIITESAAPVTQYRKTVPPNVAAAVARGLEKLPADRFATAREFGEALQSPTFTHATFGGAAFAATMPTQRGTPRARALAALPWALLVGVIGWATVANINGAADAVPPVTRFQITTVGEGEPNDAAGSPMALSPDGSRLVYVGRDSIGDNWLFVRTMDNTVPRRLNGTKGAGSPTFAPDGERIAFLQTGRIKSLDLTSGNIATIGEIDRNSFSWGPDDHLYVTSNDGLARVNVKTGTMDTLFVAPPDAQIAMRWPDALPNGRAVLVTLVREGTPHLYAYSLARDTLVDLGAPGLYPRFVNGGWIAYALVSGTLVAAPFDDRALRLTGPAVPIAERVRLGPAYPIKGAIARSGTVAFLPGDESTLNDLVVLNRAGVELQRVQSPSNLGFSHLRFSPDGRRIAAGSVSFVQRTERNIWLYDLAARTLSRLTFDSTSAATAWSANGRHIYYSRGGRSIYRIAADGSGVIDSLTDVMDNGAGDMEATPDGRGLVARYFRRGSFDRDIAFVPLDGSAARPVLASAASETAPHVSPDGQWLAYASDESGQYQVYVRRLSEGSGRWQASRSGGATPRWSLNGRELLFVARDTVFTVTFTPGAEPSFGPARALFGSRATSYGTTNTNWDVTRDGQRFAMIRLKSGESALRIEIISNWFLQPERQR